MQNTHGRGCETKLEEGEELLQGKGSLKEVVNFKFYDFAYLLKITLIFRLILSNSPCFSPKCSIVEYLNNVTCSP